MSDVDRLIKRAIDLKQKPDHSLRAQPSMNKQSLEAFMDQNPSQRRQARQGDDMTAEEFFARNPGARDMDAERRKRVEQAQARAKQRTPRTRPTERSQKEAQQREQQSWYDDGLPKNLSQNPILKGALGMIGRPSE